MNIGFVVDRRLAGLNPASNPVPVRQLASLLHTSFRQGLTALPLCFTSLHLHPVGRGTHTSEVSRYARHTILRVAQIDEVEKSSIWIGHK